MLLKQKILSVRHFSSSSLFQYANVEIMTTCIEKTPCDRTSKTIFISHSNQCDETRRIICDQAELKRLPKGHLGFPLFAKDPKLIRTLGAFPELGKHAELRDGATTSEAYLIREVIRDSCESEDIRIVNTGTIDPHQLLWGRKQIRYLGFKGMGPVISALDLNLVNPKRLEQAQRLKVVVAGMAAQIEAAVAPPGWLCGKSAVQIFPAPGCCHFALCALLNSQTFRHLYKGLFALRGMGKGVMNIGPRQLAQTPVPIEVLSPGAPLSLVGAALNESPEKAELLLEADLICAKAYERPRTD